MRTRTLGDPGEAGVISTPAEAAAVAKRSSEAVGTGDMSIHPGTMHGNYGEISMKNIGMKVLITKRIIWNTKQKKTATNDKTRQKPDDKNTKTKTTPSQPLKSPEIEKWE